jgi:hypothetical protein
MPRLISNCALELKCRIGLVSMHAAHHGAAPVTVSMPKSYWPAGRIPCQPCSEMQMGPRTSLKKGIPDMTAASSTAKPDIAALAVKWVPVALSLFASAVFLDSLRFKFTDHVNTQEIFGALDAWAASLGAPGLFAHTGLFSQYVIGSAELVASALLLIGLTRRFRPLSVLGALLGLAVMTGAISFHLFTPLGVDPNHNGGGLFMAACGVWLSMATLLVLRRKVLFRLAADIGRIVQTP